MRGRERILPERNVQLDEILDFVRTALHLPGDANNLPFGNVAEADPDPLPYGISTLKVPPCKRLVDDAHRSSPARVSVGERSTSDERADPSASK